MPTEQERRLHRCCFTGHQPEKLHRDERIIQTKLDWEIRRAIDEGFTSFITGMARGVDLWEAQIVLRQRAQNPRIKLICAVPYEGLV